jgi:HD-GYP domain-containing protein (c-di-GMP phosphodiesterase class II)
MSITRIPVAKLEVGMYVSRLDRPWRETPFFFQGFYVEQPEELDALRRLCKHVYVVVPDEKAARPKDKPLPGPHSLATYVEEILDGRAPLPDEELAPFEDEIESAKKYHADLTRVSREIWDQLREGNKMDPEILRDSVSVMVESIQRNPSAFVWLARVKEYDSYTYAHAVNVSAWVALFGRQLKLPQDELAELAMGALCLDIGNIKLPHKVLNKTGRLSSEEWELVKTHVDRGVEILEQTEGIGEQVIAMVASHHERYDGSGYPRGLQADEIPLSGQVAGIVDTYVSITFPRPAGRAVSSDFAVNTLYRQRDQYFKSALVETFIQSIGLYPAGSLVELSSGEVAVVVAQDRKHKLRPRIMLILDKNKQPYESYPIVDLVKETHDKDGTPIAIARGVPDGVYKLDLGRLPF